MLCLSVSHGSSRLFDAAMVVFIMTWNIFLYKLADGGDSACMGDGGSMLFLFSIDVAFCLRMLALLFICLARV